MLIASLILDRPPVQWAELPRLLMTWVQNVGGLSALAALFWFVVRVIRGFREGRGHNIAPAALWIFGAAWVGYVVVFVLMAVNAYSNETLGYLVPARDGSITAGDWLLAAVGGLALAGVLGPILWTGGTRLRWARIWAMARLSLKEAVRSRVVLVFGLLLPILLFAAWFIPYKPENQLRNYVYLLYLFIWILFFLTTSLLGAFGIPTDVKSQSIHTIVTKPVEKFEIVLGRFLGYATLITVGMAATTALSMLYLVRGITDEAKLESYTARVPIYGKLYYEGKPPENVGREHDFRGYITGQQPNQPRPYAIWKFDELPGNLGADGAPVRCEFDFDIYRLTKGVENQGVLCTFWFADGRLPIGEFDKVKEQLKSDLDRLQAAARQEVRGDAKALEKAVEAINVQLLRQHRMVITAGKQVTDYHTQSIEVPAALFQRLYELEGAEPRQGSKNEEKPPMLQIAVSVDRDARGANQQMLGVAWRDLYLLAAEKHFLVNFVKGILGLWCLMMLVLGVAVTCSTYLSGVISWLCTVFVVLAGLFVADIQSIAENRSAGGGPLESMYRVLKRTPIVGELDESPTATVISGADEIYRWFLRRFLNLIPDVTHYDWQLFVADGFDIAWGEMLLLNSFLPLVGYLLPCAILSFYLMKFREIANPM